MSLNEVLWNKLDLSEFGILENVEIFDTPQLAEFYNDYSPLHYGNDICYRLSNSKDKMYIMHASCKYPEACKVVWSTYVKYRNVINDVLGVSTAIRNVDPADCPEMYSKDIVDMYGGIKI